MNAWRPARRFARSSRRPPPPLHRPLHSGVRCGAGSMPATPAVEAPAELLARVRLLRARWQQEIAARGVEPARAAELDRRFAAAFERLRAARPEAFAGTDLDPDANRQRMEALVGRIEKLAASFRGPRRATKRRCRRPPGSRPCSRRRSPRTQSAARSTRVAASAPLRRMCGRRRPAGRESVPVPEAVATRVGGSLSAGVPRDRRGRPAGGPVRQIGVTGGAGRAGGIRRAVRPARAGRGVGDEIEGTEAWGIEGGRESSPELSNPRPLTPKSLPLRFTNKPGSS